MLAAKLLSEPDEIQLGIGFTGVALAFVLTVLTIPSSACRAAVRSGCLVSRPGHPLSGRTAMPEIRRTAPPCRCWVDGSKVTKPGDGAASSDTVREMFPEDLADFVLSNQDSPEVRP